MLIARSTRSASPLCLTRSSSTSSSVFPGGSDPLYAAACDIRKAGGQDLFGRFDNCDMLTCSENFRPPTTPPLIWSISVKLGRGSLSFFDHSIDGFGSKKDSCGFIAISTPQTALTSPGGRACLVGLSKYAGFLDYCRLVNNLCVFRPPPPDCIGPASV